VKFLAESKEIETKKIEPKTETEEKEETIVKLRAFPQICTFTNEEGNGYDIEIYLPGVEKETIELKMNKDYILDLMNYVAQLSLKKRFPHIKKVY